MRLFVSNFPWSTSSEELQYLFEAYGSVRACDVMFDRETQRSRGFAFVEFDDARDALMDALNLTDFNGRDLRVTEARPKTNNGRG